MARAPRHSTPSNSRPARRTAAELPSRDAVVAAMAEHPELDGKRELARHFGIKGDLRTPFKNLLREMEGEGILSRSRRQIRRTAALPAVTVLDIPANADPEDLHALPARWNPEEDGEPPRVTVLQPKTARVVPGPGDRILARIETGGGPVPHYTARAMKILDKPRRGRIGIVRLDECGARLVPV
ncbi:MAG TPA: ribonuclease R, partial [Alphaproteobacteria bacterium]|nr:ribonuclease R [Alphaproteobacteria bacterium]